MIYDSDIILLLLNYVKFNEYKEISQINKDIYKKTRYNIPYRIKKEYAIKNLSGYPNKLFDIFDPIKLFKLNNIYIKNGFIGDYIDFLDKSHFKNNNLIRGNDLYNRYFISFKYEYENQFYVTTLFQRYSNDIYRWVSGGKSPFGYTIIIDFDEYFIENDAIKFYINLFNSL